MSYNLYLDDIRQPHETGNYILPVHYRAQYHLDDWVVVRNYNEFVKTILEKGLPWKISFDHDLATEHYTPEEYWNDYDASKAFQEARTYREKTGLDCARWLTEFCAERGLKLPDIYIHSMNPVGADNIRNHLNQFV